jgi:hypothetical protein
MDLKDLSALGGAASALIAAFSYWAKTRHERRRATRRILFYLLELHHVAHRVRAASRGFRSEFLHVFGAAIQARGFVFNESETAAVLKQAEPVLAAFGRKQLEATVADSSEAFTNALADLSKEDPVLAFRLRGRDQLMLMPQKLESLLAQHTTPSNSTAPNVRDSTVFDEFLAGMAIEDLELAIRAVARTCDFVTHLRVTLLLRKAARDQVSDDLKSIVA